MANPSYIADPFWTVVAMNSAASSIFDTRIGASCLQRFCPDQDLARSHVHQEMMARSTVAQFRAQPAKFLDDPRFEIIARGLCEASKALRELWQSQVYSRTAQERNRHPGSTAWAEPEGRGPAVRKNGHVTFDEPDEHKVAIQDGYLGGFGALGGPGHGERQCGGAAV